MGQGDVEATEQLAGWIRERRLEPLALALLEIARPFGFIASQGLLLCQPLLSFCMDESRLSGYAELLADRTNIDRLMARLGEEGA